MKLLLAFLLSPLLAADIPIWVDVSTLIYGNATAQEQAWSRLEKADQAQVAKYIVEALKKDRIGRRNNDPVSERNIQGLKALARVKSSGLPPFMELLKTGYYVGKSDHASLTEYFRTLGKESVEPLFLLLSATTFELKETGYVLLGSLIEFSLPKLEIGLKDSDKNIREQSVRAIGLSSLDAAKKMELLLPLLKDKKGWIASTVSNALQKLGPEAIPALQSAAAQNPSLAKDIQRTIARIESNSELAMFRQDQGSPSGDREESLKKFAGTYSVKEPQTFGKIALKWEGGKLTGEFEGEESFGEHGSGYYRVSLDGIKLLSSGKLAFQAGKRLYYRDPKSLKEGKENSGVGNTPIEFYCGLSGDELSCRCAEKPLDGCSYNKVTFVRK